MSETEHEDELTEPSVKPVPETDQESDDDEAEEAEGEDQPPADQLEETPEAQGPTQEEMEARFTYADRTFATYAKKVEAKWEEDAVHLVRFNLDTAAPPGYLDLRNKGHVDDDTKAAALGFLGFGGESDMKPDPYSRPCETCAGFGEVVTGSKVANHDTRTCGDCDGVGYVAEGKTIPTFTGNGFDAEANEEGQLVPAATSVESPELEAWRRKGYTIIPPMKANG